ncbi:M20/M25/M40 family metallo-hydrolase [bacterium]|nr:M20/M25/M40 family metallo-hydrolase [bacterium]
MFESAEKLIANGYKPERTVILAFGHDEEVLGLGAEAIVANLQDKGLHLAAVIDEGGSIYNGTIPGISGLTATIGIAEKGFLSLKLTVESEGGHSSTPPPESAIGILSRAITRLESNPFPADISSARMMFQGLAPASSFWMQVGFANLWLFKGLMLKHLSRNTETNAMIRTTTAPTIFHSGVKDNVLPGKAEAVVNFRLLGNTTIADACTRVRKVINDPRVTFEPVPGHAKEPSAISPHESLAFQHISAAITRFFPGTVVAPYIVMGGTDARNFYAICEQVYRFTPIVTLPEDLNRVHGINERISIEALRAMVSFFYELITRWSAE